MFPLSIPIIVYMGPLTVPETISIFSPVPKVAVWFQTNVEASTMIVLSTTLTHIVDLTTERSRTTTYHQDGSWTDSSDTSIDFTKVTPAFVGVKKKHRVGFGFTL